MTKIIIVVSCSLEIIHVDGGNTEWEGLALFSALAVFMFWVLQEALQHSKPQSTGWCA